MNRLTATNLMQDIEKNIDPSMMIDDIYLSIKDVGTKIFRQCTYHEDNEWLFIWTTDDSFMVKKSDLGDFVMVPMTKNFTTT